MQGGCCCSYLRIFRCHQQLWIMQSPTAICGFGMDRQRAEYLLAHQPVVRPTASFTVLLPFSFLHAVFPLNCSMCQIGLGVTVDAGIAMSYSFTHTRSISLNSSLTHPPTHLLTHPPSHPPHPSTHPLTHSVNALQLTHSGFIVRMQAGVTAPNSRTAQMLLLLLLIVRCKYFGHDRGYSMPASATCCMLSAA